MTLPTIAASVGAWLWDKYGEKIGERVLGQAKENWARVNWNAAAETYRAGIIDLYGTTQIFGQPRPVSLDDVFTDVYLLEKPTAFQRFDIRHLQTDPELLVSTRRIPGATLAKQREAHRLFVLGKPGAGKTTFLKYLAIEAARGNLDKVPVFVTLKSWADSGLDLMSFISRQFAICGFPDATAFIEHLLKETEDALILFDGLDELRQEDQTRARTVNALRDFAWQYKRAQCIITCRIAATDYTFEQFAYVEVADFTTEQVDIFVAKWYHEMPNKGEAFLREIGREEHRGLRELARVPLLLAMLCLAFNDTLRFPARRVEIYEDALDALLRKWDASRNIRRDEIYRDLSAGRKHQLLARIAAQTFEVGDYFLSQVNLEAMITAYLSRLPHSDVAGGTIVDSGVVLKAIEAQHGILVERAHRIYSFAHLSFQEYYMTRYIVDNMNSGTLTRLVSHCHDPRWREVILLTASLLDNADEMLVAFRTAVDKLIALDATCVALVSRATDNAEQHKQRDLGLFSGRVYHCCLLLDVSILQASSSALVQALALVGSLRQARSLARDLIGAPDLVRSLALSRDLAQVLDRAVDLDRARNHDLDRARALDQALDRALELNRTNTTVLVGAFDRVRTLDRTLDRTHAQTLSCALDRTLTLVFDGDSPVTSTAELALTRDIDLALDLANDFVNGLIDVVEARTTTVRNLCQFLGLGRERETLSMLEVPRERDVLNNVSVWVDGLQASLSEPIRFSDLLSVEQSDRLSSYFVASRLLLDCLEVASVSNREAIADSVLLPEEVWQSEDLVKAG